MKKITSIFLSLSIMLSQSVFAQNNYLLPPGITENNRVEADLAEELHMTRRTVVVAGLLSPFISLFNNADAADQQRTAPSFYEMVQMNQKLSVKENEFITSILTKTIFPTQTGKERRDVIKKIMDEGRFMLCKTDNFKNILRLHNREIPEDMSIYALTCVYEHPDTGKQAYLVVVNENMFFDFFNTFATLAHEIFGNIYNYETNQAPVPGYDREIFAFSTEIEMLTEILRRLKLAKEVTGITQYDKMVSNYTRILKAAENSKEYFESVKRTAEDGKIADIDSDKRNGIGIKTSIFVTVIAAMVAYKFLSRSS